jgi:hypothetical protein
MVFLVQKVLTISSSSSSSYTHSAYDQIQFLITTSYLRTDWIYNLYLVPCRCSCPYDTHLVTELHFIDTLALCI